MKLLDENGNIKYTFRYDPNEQKAYYSDQAYPANTKVYSDYTAGTNPGSFDYGYAGNYTVTSYAIFETPGGTSTITYPVVYAPEEEGFGGYSVYFGTTTMHAAVWEQYDKDMYLFAWAVLPGKYTVVVEEDETLSLTGVTAKNSSGSW